MQTDLTNNHIEIYESSKSMNYQDIIEIIKELKIDGEIDHNDFAFFINSGIENLIQKWRSGRKILRTNVAKEIIDDYPEKILRSSIIIDASINLLDDLFDEKMDKQEKGLYIIELLRINAILLNEGLNVQQQKYLSMYYNKLLCIAIPEFIYKEKIMNSDYIDDVIRMTMQCYDCKSMDMDIFLELPLSEMDKTSDEIQSTVDMGRIHRALVLMKKDIQDIDHDVSNDTITPMVILHQRDDFKKTVLTIIDEYLSRTGRLREALYHEKLNELIAIDKNELESIMNSCTLRK